MSTIEAGVGRQELLEGQGASAGRCPGLDWLGLARGLPPIAHAPCRQTAATIRRDARRARGPKPVLVLAPLPHQPPQ